MHKTRQVEIIHLSDLHFGSHRFDPDPAPDGTPLPTTGMPTLADSLIADFRTEIQLYPVVEAGAVHQEARQAPRILCITGDFAHSATYDEFKRAYSFITSLATAPEIGLEKGIESVFIVPGNHDIFYDTDDMAKRWSEWAKFYNKLYGEAVPDEDPWSFVRLHYRPSQGLMVLCLNSEIYVRAGSPSAHRGLLDQKQLKIIEELISSVPRKDCEACIKVALVHHHPVLIPSLVEPGRNYDAIIDAGPLLTILHRYGFHILLHGHKHYPHTFLEDIRNGFEQGREQPLMIVAGGAAGAKGFPTAKRATNAYNRITVKWNEEAEYTRIRVLTRGLATYHPQDHSPLLSSQWHWETLREDDRHFSTYRRLPTPKREAWNIDALDPTDPAGAEKARKAEYARTRLNMAVVDVRPSLVEGEVYEARFWIVGHKGRTTDDIPVEVTWSAGPLFPVITIKREDDPWPDDPRFCASFDYYGSMLIQARLRFSEGPEVYAYVYARIPGDNQ